MLIQPDSTKLGDRSLSAKEALAKSFEETNDRLDTYRLDDHEDLKNMEKRMGKVMTHAELIQKVTKLNPNVWAEDSLSNPHTVAGFYYKDREGNKAFVCAFEKGPLPEFSYILTDKADLAVQEKRGWRTVLVRLLKMGLLSWEQIVLGFGDPMNANTERWRSHTQAFRA